MIEPTPYSIPKTWLVPQPAALFAGLSLGVLIVIAGSAQILFAAPIAPILVFCAIVGLSLRGLITSYPHDTLGACNVITLIRMAIVALMTGAIFAPAAPWLVFGLAAMAFASDGLDGWFARRAKLTSDFGARFDMEADALLAAVLSLILLVHGTVGPAILVLGFARYAFVAAGGLWPALQGDLPESFRRKTICVVQIAALIALICPLTPAFLSPWVTAVVAGMLVYTFAVDARTLMRREA